jgi:outer membrane protein W
MLDSCLKDGFNKEQTIQAYRLLIQVYLFDYNQDKAEKAMLSLLSEFPEYEIQSNDPVEFVNLYKQFQTRPRFSISINSGVNISDVSVTEQYSTGNLNNLKPTYKSDGLKAGVRLSFEKYIASKIWITLGVGYTFAGYEAEEKMNFNREVLAFSEKMQFLQFPLYLNYSFGNSKKFTPYIFAGGKFSYLLKAEGEINRRSLDLSSVSTDLSGIAQDVTNARMRDNYSVLGGVGFRYKISSGYLRVNLFYTRGMSDYIKKGARFSNNENLFYYNFIDDKIRLNFYNLSVGYSYIFYRTQKRINESNN